MSETFAGARPSSVLNLPGPAHHLARVVTPLKIFKIFLIFLDIFLQSQVPHFFCYAVGRSLRLALIIICWVFVQGQGTLSGQF